MGTLFINIIKLLETEQCLREAGFNHPIRFQRFPVPGPNP